MDTEATIHDLAQRLEDQARLVAEQARRMEAQERLVAALLARLGSGDVAPEPRVEPEARSRREVLSRAGAVVVGAAAAAVTASVVRASPAAANFDGTSVSASTNNFGVYASPNTHPRPEWPRPSICAGRCSRPRQTPLSCTCLIAAAARRCLTLSPGRST